jgi:hypothetical protein
MPYPEFKIESDYERGNRDGKRDQFKVDYRSQWQQGYDSGRAAANPLPPLALTDYDKGYTDGKAGYNRDAFRIDLDLTRKSVTPGGTTHFGWAAG